MPQLFIFGDSITWGAWDSCGGWAHRLKQEIDSYQVRRSEFCYPTYILGIPGDTVAGILGRFENEFRARQDVAEKPIIIFAIGVNDSVYHLDEKKPAFSEEQFQRNIAELFCRAAKFTDQIAFVGINPILESHLNPVSWNPSRAYLFKSALAFNQLIRKFCARERLGFADLWSDWARTEYSGLLYDGLHPNPSGHERIWSLVRDCFTEGGWLPEGVFPGAGVKPSFVQRPGVMLPDLLHLKIETERLELQSLTMSAAQSMFSEFTPEITRYMMPPSPQHISETEKFISTSLEGMEAKKSLELVILDKESKEFLGVCGLHLSHRSLEPELGLWVKKSAHGHRYGREAIHAIKRFADEHILYDWLIYPVDRANTPSRKIPESFGAQYTELGRTLNLSGGELDEIVYRVK